MATTFDSVFVNGVSLRPAPYVSTSYEYNRSGEYVIGGFLIVTLSGTIVGEDIAAKINQLSSLQMLTNCVSVMIGCSGGSDFLNGAGRIRSVTINPSDQPYLASYSIQIALETVDAQPAVEADEEFLRQTCLNTVGTNISFLQSYNETLSISGEGNTIASVDNTLQVSKSYIKASGRISMASFMKEICGIPQYNGINNSIEILKLRAQSLMSMQICVPESPLAQFSGWNKWLDTKTLTINGDGSVDWTFDLYMSKGSAKPFAWIDITTEDRGDQKRKNNTKNISGTIRGLSSANLEDYLADRVNVNERIGNARTAYSALESIISNGSWPTENVVLTGKEIVGPPKPVDPCDNQEPETCNQRISSTIKTSPINGEITFSAEYGPISSCKPRGVGKIESTIEEKLPSNRHIEYIIPGAGDSLVIDLRAPTPWRVTISTRGSLQGCDKTKLGDLINCVEQAFNQIINTLDGAWLELNRTQNIGTYSYSLSKEFVRCEG
jgi:hypothetical protein